MYFGDLGAAAVDDHRVQPDVLEQDHVRGEGLAQGFVPHRRSAVLDDDGLAVELADVGQGLEQHVDVVVVEHSAADRVGDLLCLVLGIHSLSLVAYYVVYSALITMYSWVRSLK